LQPETASVGERRAQKRVIGFDGPILGGAAASELR